MQPLNASRASSKTRLRMFISKVRRRKTGEWPVNAAFAPCRTLEKVSLAESGYCGCDLFGSRVGLGVGLELGLGLVAVVDIPLALVAHAHTDVHQELEETFLIFKDIAPERRVVQRHCAMHQSPGGAVMEIRRDIFKLAFGNPAFDQQGQVFEVRRADLVQLFDQLWHLIALDDLLF